MKKIIYIIICVVFTQSAFAQEDAKTLQHEVGINTLLLQNLIVNQGETQPFTFSYKLILDNKAIRFGVGGTFDRVLRREDGFADSETNITYNTDLRIGFEWRKTLGDNNNWLTYFGVDAVGLQAMDKTIIDSGFDKVSEYERALGFGAGPVVGLQYYINDHLSISTEGAIYFMKQESTSARLFENFPDFDDILNTIDEFHFNTILPTSIYFNYKF